jgi:hypothetical protein
MRIEEIRSGLCARLRSRQGEIQAAMFARVQAISDPRQSTDPDYAEGLRVAIATALDYGIAALERSEDRVPPIPTALLSQARLAVRSRVSLDTVLRRYFAGYTLLGDFVIEEAERAGISSGPALKRLLRAQAGVLDRLLASVSEEYKRESDRPSSSEERRAERIGRLLGGEPLDTSDLAYDFGGWHLGIVAAGPGATEAIGNLASPFDCRLLIVCPREGAVWAWLGSRRAFSQEGLKALDSPELPSSLSLAIGEPGEGLGGWRLTHRQAKAALPIASRLREGVVHYAEVALLASMLGDDLLVASLRQLYLAPLAEEREGGAVARETLMAYFAADRNVSSAAARLGVSRHAVARRLRAVEERIGCPLSHCYGELEAALRISTSLA